MGAPGVRRTAEAEAGGVREEGAMGGVAAGGVCLAPEERAARVVWLAGRGLGASQGSKKASVSRECFTFNSGCHGAGR